MPEDLVFCAKYPFTKEAKACLEAFGADFSQVSDEMLDIASARVKNAGKPSDRLKQIESSRGSYLVNEITSFPLAKVLAALNGDRLLKKQFAESEARDVYYFLQLDTDDNLMKVAGQTMPLSRRGGRFAVQVADYLNNIPNGKEYKLVNSELSRGEVLVEKETVA
ncbi:MAG: hypothetical protein QXO69_03540, partial [archaeon]